MRLPLRGPGRGSWLYKKLKGPHRARCGPEGTEGATSVASGLPGDDPVAALVAVPRPHLEVAAVLLVRGPRHLLAGGLGRVERVRPVVRAVPQVVAVEAVVALVLPVPCARRGGSTGDGVVGVALVVGAFLVVVVVRVATAIGLADAGRGEGGEGRQGGENEPSHGASRSGLSDKRL